MKLKNIRVRLKDIHHGKILYVAHPAFGIERVKIVGKPVTVMLGKVLGLPGRPALFINTMDMNHNYASRRSLSDMGVYNMYGYRRTFHTMRQAQAYVKRMKGCPEFLKYHQMDLDDCKDMFSVFD